MSSLSLKRILKTSLSRYSWQITPSLTTEIWLRDNGHWRKDLTTRLSSSLASFLFNLDRCLSLKNWWLSSLNRLTWILWIWKRCALTHSQFSRIASGRSRSISTQMSRYSQTSLTTISSSWTPPSSATSSTTSISTSRDSSIMSSS